MSLGTAINDVQRLCSLPVTSSIVADGQETQNLLFGLAKRSAKSLMRRHTWPDLKSEHSFTATTGATLQADGKPDNFDRIIPDSMWNRTTNRQVLGVTTPAQWQKIQGLPIAVSVDQIYMLRSDGLHLGPEAPTAADSIYYEYMINTPVLDSDGTTYQTNFDADTDTFVLDEELLILDVVWRWKQAKGLPYAEEMKEAELRIESEINATRSTSPIYIASPPRDLSDGQIPDGSWDLS